MDHELKAEAVVFTTLLSNSLALHIGDGGTQSNGKPFSLLHTQMCHSFIRESASKKVAKLFFILIICFLGLACSTRRMLNNCTLSGYLQT